ncbi:SDR family oxidoreductase [Janthinobacterium rivuli]|uniref:SDR family oxidoreductase n=1 Tax=Janthinobacterium sp. FT68W TaxID=2654255 RepID=UPI0012658509|nr:SDR family oxidoreductase [Janthinobacterium sp. FT68W]
MGSQKHRAGLPPRQENSPSTPARVAIGAAIARRLARDGAQVVVNYVSGKGAADELVAAIVADAGEVLALFDAAEAAYGGVDVLVNNAGIMPPMLPTLADTDDATFDSLFAINVKGSFNTMRQAATRLRHGGSVVNFSTSVIGLALPGYSVYSATKAAIETMTAIFAKALRGKNITVNAVAPGPTATTLFLNGKNEETIAPMGKMAPLERLGTPDDIAGAVAFLAGPDGRWVNGQTLRANGCLV